MEEGKLEYISLDGRNAILFNLENTRYIKEKVRDATLRQYERKRIFAEMARHFFVDTDRMNEIVVMYVNRLRAYERMHGVGAEPPPASQNDTVRLCRAVGHRFIDIKLSHLRHYWECQRCRKAVKRVRRSD